MSRLTRMDLVTYGLALCYLVHDGEELLTYRASSARVFGSLPARVPLPAELRERGWSQNHVNLGIALMGVHWVGAALAGRRSGGHSAWFQNALAVWGLHGVGHLGMCLLRGGYVSGAFTAPLVIGYGAWAWRELRAEGVPCRVSAGGAAASLPALLAAHAGAEGILRVLEGPSARPAGASGMSEDSTIGSRWT